MQIQIIETSEILSPSAFFDRHANVAFAQPLTDDVLQPFGARLYVPPVDIEAFRAEARERVNAWRDAREREGIVFEHAGRRWDGGLAVRERLMPMLTLPQLPEGFFWTDADDVDVEMTAESLAALAAAHELAIVTRGFEIHTRQRLMKAEIDTMDDAEALRAYRPS